LAILLIGCLLGYHGVLKFINGNFYWCMMSVADVAFISLNQSSLSARDAAQVLIHARGCWQRAGTRETTSGSLTAAWCIHFLACNLKFILIYNLHFPIQFQTQTCFHFLLTEMQIIVSEKPVSLLQRATFGFLLEIQGFDSCTMKYWNLWIQKLNPLLLLKTAMETV
jgi:hypothetical protein